MNDFYVYRHLKADSKVVFYVGKGCKGRAYNFKFRSDYHKRIVKKHGCIVEIVHSGLSQEESFSKEIELISYYKSIGQCEANFTMGGEGCLGRKVTLETRLKISKSVTGLKHSEETKLQMSKSRVGHPGYTKGMKMSKESSLKKSKFMKDSLTNCKPIKCVNTGEIFKSLSDAVT